MPLRAAFSTSETDTRITRAPLSQDVAVLVSSLYTYRVFIHKSIKDGHSRVVTSRGISEKRDSGGRAYKKSEIRSPGLAGSLIATLLL